MTRRVVRGFLPHKHAELRAAKGYTVADLARLAQVQDRTIHEWESGETVPGLVNLRKSARVLKVGIPDIVHVPPGKRMLSDLINRKALTPPEFAKAVGISTTYYYEIERGKKKPADLIVRQMAAQLKVSPKTIMDAWGRAQRRAPGTPA